MLGGVLISVIAAVIGILLSLVSAGVSLTFTAQGILKAIKQAGKLGARAARSAVREGAQIPRQIGRTAMHGLPNTLRGTKDLLKGRVPVELHRPIGKAKNAARRYVTGKVDEVGGVAKAVISLRTRASHKLQSDRGTGVFDSEVEVGVPFQSGPPTNSTRAITASEWDVLWQLRNPTAAEKYLSQKHPKEVLAVYDDKNRLIGAWVGDAESVSPTYTERQTKRMRGGIGLHSHPVDVSFSIPDMRTAYNRGWAETRAVSEQHVYSMKPVRLWTPAEIEDRFDIASTKVTPEVMAEAALDSSISENEIVHRSWEIVAEETGIVYEKRPVTSPDPRRFWPWQWFGDRK